MDHRNKVEVVVLSLKSLLPQEEEGVVVVVEEVEVVEGQQQQESEQRGMDRMVKQTLQKKQNKVAMPQL